MRESKGRPGSDWQRSLSVALHGTRYMGNGCMGNGHMGIGSHEMN